MDRIKMRSCWEMKKKSRLKEEVAVESLQMLPGETQEHTRGKRKGRGWKLPTPFHRGKNHAKHIQLQETSRGFQQLVQEGQFREACQSILASAQHKQDCGPQYELVAQNMWQVVQQALGDVRHSQELEPKLQAVMAAVEWAREDESQEAAVLRDGGVTSWGRKLEGLLRRDAEARLPTLGPEGKLGPYLEELDKAIAQGLGSQRAGQLGTHFWATYRTCFQNALLSRLSQLASSPDCSCESCCKLYTWGKITLFGQLGREMPLNGPSTSQTPRAGNLLDPMVFVNWMSQIQEKLVGLTQEKLERRLKNILSHDQKEGGHSPSPVFLDIFQLLKETMNSVQHIGSPITGRVQAMVLETFSKFLEKYQAEAEVILQQNKDTNTFPQMHVLGNCSILRETWEQLSRVHDTPADPGTHVQSVIRAIEEHSQDHLRLQVRALCQNVLRGHFGGKDKDLARALQSLWQGLEGCHQILSTSTHQSLVKCLHAVIFWEYVQALVAHLRTLAPRMLGDLRAQVEMDTCKLGNILREHGGSDLDDLREPIMGIFQLREDHGGEAVAGWLASFSDRFPDYVSPSMQDQPCSSMDLEDIEVERSCRWCCCLPWLLTMTRGSRLQATPPRHGGHRVKTRAYI
ncbi:uncharacterized protein LOC118910690 isoform X3 [Manis pentadactyla]|uniref:uncharacterized protein LOC118910690 isoform X3 n=1 Tax=Manis pentadactyla TaxID=143292 RepID=UPI00255CB7C2|nr:uncharacterized protein LOC118910690 isoform X3 [Manis pentadactyla]